MLDCWMAFDVEYTVRPAERLRPYGLKWIEECLLSEDFEGIARCVSACLGRGWPRGNTGISHVPFSGPVPIGLPIFCSPTSVGWRYEHVSKNCRSRRRSGVTVLPHGGAAQPSDSTFRWLAARRWPSIIGSPPGVPLEELPRMPGVAIAQDGYVVPSDGPGFGMGVSEDWLVPFF